MLTDAAQTVDLELLDDALRLAPALFPQLFRKITEDCTRLASLRQSGKAAGLDRLIEASAWTDAAFVLIHLELPNWRVRRVVRENGEWLCSLSPQPNLLVALDEMAEAKHEVFALAILRAFVEARRRSTVAPHAISTVPQVRPATEQLICCDNFA
jgi:hypothetical protein